MSLDGLLPDDVTESMVPGNRPGDNHDKRCPQHEDAPDRCECGCSVEVHVLFIVADQREMGPCLTILAKPHWLPVELAKYWSICACDGFCKVEPNCECADLAEQAKADRDEAAYERSRGDA